MVVQQMVEFLRDAFDAGMAKMARGSAVIAAAGTFVDVAFSSVGATFSVAVTPTVDPTLRYWVSNKTAGSFRINLSAGAPAGGVGFDWIAKGA